MLFDGDSVQHFLRRGQFDRVDDQIAGDGVDKFFWCVLEDEVSLLFLGRGFRDQLLQQLDVFQVFVVVANFLKILQPEVIRVIN